MNTILENDSRPIGVFDSGVGGLTAMRELLRILPEENFVYFGDTARVPYGSRNRETIIQFAREDLNFLLTQNVKAVLVACGTVSSTAMEELWDMTDIPVVGVIEPASRAALRETKNRRIAILATPATIRSQAYRKTLLSLGSGGEAPMLFEQACPLFVPVVENGYVDKDHPIVKAVIEEYIRPVLNFGADTVILGCTHYPLLKDAIQSYAPELCIVESGKEAAIALAALIRKTGTQDGKRERKYYVSENTEAFRDICELFVGEKIQGKIRTFKPGKTQM